MVRGLGIDIVEIARIERMIRNYGVHFLEKVFTENEIGYCNAKASPAIHFAGRWASKEAFYKALPASAQDVATWKSVEVLPDTNSAKPKIRILSPGLAESVRKESINSIQLSISHERTLCTAVILLEQTD